MSRQTSEGAGKRYGLKRVCRVLEFPRSTLYDRQARESATEIPLCPQRRGPKPKVADIDLLAAIRADLEASPFIGEGHRKVWARLRILHAVCQSERCVNDIMQATEMARRMVTEFGMSEKLGPLRYSDGEQEVFLGYSMGQQRKSMSGETMKLIDQEVRRIVETGEKKARELLTRYLDGLHTVAKALVEYETLTGEEVRALLNGEAIRQDTGHGGSAPAPAKPRSSIPTSGGAVSRPGFEPKPQPGA